MRRFWGLNGFLAASSASVIGVHRTGNKALMQTLDEVGNAQHTRASAAPPTFAIHSYPVEKRCPISCNIKGCMSSVLKKAQDRFENSLDGITLADVVGEIRRASR